MAAKLVSLFLEYAKEMSLVLSCLFETFSWDVKMLFCIDVRNSIENIYY